MKNRPTTKSADSVKVHGLSLLIQSSSYEVVYPAGSEASLNSIIVGAHVISSLKKKNANNSATASPIYQLLHSKFTLCLMMTFFNTKVLGQFLRGNLFIPH